MTLLNRRASLLLSLPSFSRSSLSLLNNITLTLHSSFLTGTAIEIIELVVVMTALNIDNDNLLKIEREGLDAEDLLSTKHQSGLSLREPRGVESNVSHDFNAILTPIKLLSLPELCLAAKIFA